MSPSQPSESLKNRPLLLELAGAAHDFRASDIHLSPGSPVTFRSNGKIFTPKDRMKAELLKGVLDLEIFDENGCIRADKFDAIKQLVTGGKASDALSFTKVFTDTKVQVRVNYSRLVFPEELVIRIQPATHYGIDEYLKDYPAVKTAMRDSKGLTVITGPIGGGKTSLQSSILQFWCQPGVESSKRVMSIADCREFFPKPGSSCASIECSLSDIDKNKAGETHISDVVPIVLRSDIDALSIGEIRDPGALRVALDFASTREPVITTLHGGSIADCIIRMLGMAERVMTPETARLVLSNCLDGIAFINVAYNSKGVPVPVVEYLSVSECPGLKTSIAKGDPTAIAAAAETALSANLPNNPTTNRSGVMTMLRKNGFSDTEIHNVIGKGGTLKR